MLPKNVKKSLIKLNLEYEYLSDIEKLEDNEKNICKKWCSKTEYKSDNYALVGQSFQDLSEYLF